MEHTEANSPEFWDQVLSFAELLQAKLSLHLSVLFSDNLKAIFFVLWWRQDANISSPWISTASVAIETEDYYVLIFLSYEINQGKEPCHQGSFTKQQQQPWQVHLLDFPMTPCETKGRNVLTCSGIKQGLLRHEEMDMTLKGKTRESFLHLQPNQQYCC